MRDNGMKILFKCKRYGNETGCRRVMKVNFMKKVWDESQVKFQSSTRF